MNFPVRTVLMILGGTSAFFTELVTKNFPAAGKWGGIALVVAMLLTVFQGKWVAKLNVPEFLPIDLVYIGMVSGVMGSLGILTWGIKPMDDLLGKAAIYLIFSMVFSFAGYLIAKLEKKAV